ncbi:hypothetical protein B7463_g9793, partial [Scytalidium lignicola]
MRYNITHIASTSTNTTSAQTTTTTAGGNPSPTTTTTTRTPTTTTTTAQPTTASATPPPGEVFIAGTGVVNYLGLCYFCCSFGYCPPGSCTCTAYGAQVSPPAANRRDRVPIAEEDDS